jgi:hypothetical protein
LLNPVFGRPNFPGLAIAPASRVIHNASSQTATVFALLKTGKNSLLSGAKSGATFYNERYVK